VWANERWLRVTSAEGLNHTLGRRGKEDLKAWLQGRPVQGGHEDGAIRDLALINCDTILRVTKTHLRSPSTSTRGAAIYAVTAIDPPRRSAVPAAVQPLTSPPARPSKSPISQSRSHTRRRSHNAAKSPLSTIALDTAQDALLLTPPLPTERISSVDLTDPELDCRRLLETTDWAATSLGPKEGWSPVVHTMIDVLMRSPTQDALWLGPDFNMI